MLSADTNRFAVKRDAQVIAHGLQFAVLLSFEPGKNRVTREEFDPAFQGFGHFDAQLEGTLHDGRAWIRSKDVGPELSAGVLAADVHDEVNRFAALRFTLARKAEDHIE